MVHTDGSEHNWDRPPFTRPGDSSWEEAATLRYCPDTDLEVDFTSGSSGTLTCELWVDGELKDTRTRSAGSFGCSWSSSAPTTHAVLIGLMLGLIGALIALGLIKAGKQS